MLWGCCGRFWASLGYLLEGSGPVGSGSLASRGCIHERYQWPSCIRPYLATNNLLQVGAHTLQLLRMVSAQEDMFMSMRTTARGAARRGSRRRPLQKGQDTRDRDGHGQSTNAHARTAHVTAVSTSQQRHRLLETVVTDPFEIESLTLTSFLSNANAQAGAGGPGPLTDGVPSTRVTTRHGGTEHGV